MVSDMNMCHVRSYQAAAPEAVPLLLTGVINLRSLPQLQHTECTIGETWEADECEGAAPTWQAEQSDQGSYYFNNAAQASPCAS